MIELLDKSVKAGQEADFLLEYVREGLGFRYKKTVVKAMRKAGFDVTQMYVYDPSRVLARLQEVYSDKEKPNANN